MGWSVNKKIGMLRRMTNAEQDAWIERQKEARRSYLEKEVARLEAWCASKDEEDLQTLELARQETADAQAFFEKQPLPPRGRDPEVEDSLSPQGRALLAASGRPARA